MFNKKAKIQLNLYIIIGVILIVSLFVIAVFGEYLAPYDINEPQKSKIDPTTNQISFPPYSPSKDNIFGTDNRGVDVFSMILYGAKYTLFVVLAISVSRILFALPIGLIAGWYPKYLKAPSQYLNKVWNSIPLFLLVYVVLLPVVLYPSSKALQIFILWFILTFAGVVPLVEAIRKHVEEIKQYDFMEGVKVLGATPFYTLRKHIFPHLKPYIAIIFSMELAQILWLLGQLGIVHIFVGGAITIKIDEIPQYYSVTNEWAGLLGNGRRFVRSSPWLFLGPAIAFAYGIIAFQFLAEGLRIRFNKNTMKYDL